MDLYLPSYVRFEGLTVTGMDEITGADLLIGMDVMCRGDTSLTNLKGQTVFTFRYPSIHELDFVTEENEGQVKDALRGLPKTRKVQIVSPSGEERTVRKSEVVSLVRQGWRLK